MRTPAKYREEAAAYPVNKFLFSQ